MGETVDFQSATLATPPAGTKVAVDTISGEQYQKIKLYDGTLDSTVAAKVTSEGNLQAITPNRTVSGTLGALNEAVTLSLDGCSSLLGVITASTLSGNLTYEFTVDGTTWTTIRTVWSSGPGAFTSVQTDPAQGGYISASLVSGFHSFRARVSAYTSGSVTLALVGSSNETAALVDRPLQTVMLGDYTGPSARVGSGQEAEALRVTIASDSTGQIKLTDGTRTASVRDTGASDSLNVAIVDAAGNQVTSFGGGTQYAEDTAHSSGDQVTMAGVVQQTADTALSTNGDRSLLQVDASGYLKVNVKTGVTQPGVDIGDVTVNNAAGASAVNVQDGGNSLTVDGTVAVTGVSTLAEQQSQTTHLATIAGDTTDIETAVELIDDTVHADDAARGKSLLIGAVLDDTSPTVVTENQAGYLRMSSARRLLVDGSGTTQPVSGTVTVSEPVSVDDNGGSLTVDGTVAVTGVATAANQTTELASLAAIETDADAIRVATELLDDTVYTDDTSTHATGTSKGNLFMAAAAPTDAAVNANDIGALAMTTDRKLHVSVQDALPAGTNAIGKLAANSGVDIGDVDVASLPALPAGTNNIGDVDVVSLPALVAGTANIGDVDVLTVPAPLSTTGGGTEATAHRVTIASDSTGVLSVDDNGGSLTVDGTVAISGTVSTTMSLENAYYYMLPSQVHVAAANAVHWDVFNADATLIVRIISILQIPNVTTAVTGIVFDWLLERTTAVGTGGSAITAWLPDTSQTALDADITCRSKPTGGATQSTDLRNYSLSSEETNAGTIQVAAMGGLELVPVLLKESRRGIVLRQNEGIRCVQVTNSVQGNTGWLIGFTVE